MVVTVTCGQEGQQAAVSPRTSGRASARLEAPPPETCRAQRPRREICADGPGSSEARAPVHRVWSPRLNAAKEASPRHVHGRSACPRHPTQCLRRPTTQEARSHPPRPILHREPGHRWHAASRRQPGQQMLHAPFSLGEPDEPASPLGGRGWGQLSVQGMRRDSGVEAAAPHTPHPTTGLPAAGI